MAALVVLNSDLSKLTKTAIKKGIQSVELITSLSYLLTKENIDIIKTERRKHMEQNQQNQAAYPNQTQNSNIPSNVNNTGTKIKQTSGLFILFWLIIFAPIGLYLLWREKRLHGWFPNLLIFLGFLNILPVAAMMLFVFPKMVKLYEEFGANFNKNNIYLFAIAILVISFVEVVTGFFLKKKVEEEGFLKNVYVFVCLGFFVFQYVPFGWLMQSFALGFIMPIYNLTSQF